ncbi:macrolide family glycosyltransferase [Clostridium akagii]|uniref:macrolide family glycosyltransferase n=1 Tax=Clostridium akagii TaxID=91623 RepID=UPI000479D6BF|nr:macrolide family glycosyltransferase [Clostridium akagii]
MSNVLFLNVPAYGHVNPTLGLVDALVKQGESVTYFCTDEFKNEIEKTGAHFISYSKETNPLTKRRKITSEMKIGDFLDQRCEILNSSDAIIKDILDKIKDLEFDYIIYGAMFPYGNMIAQILEIPSISSFAVFATPKELMAQNKGFMDISLLKDHPINDIYKEVSKQLKQSYNVELPSNMLELFFNKGDINIAYTSKYFVSHPEYYDNSFIFIGPPIYNREEDLNFPFEKLQGKKVIYISLGTVFNNTNSELYDIFFRSFANTEAIVVMAAYNVDLSGFDVPKNFIVRNYVPQSEILKYTDVAITHAGMNSTSDLLYNNVPFVAIPISADQPYMAGRASELGATIALDKDKLTPEILKNSVNEVLTNPSYLENIKKISSSFKQTGGYKRAVEEIFNLKKGKHILA